MRDINSNSNQPSDEKLVERFLEGDKSALDELLQRYHSRVYRLAYGILRNPQDAEEVIQEVFLRVFQKLDSFKGESSFSSWLYRVAINTTYMKLRDRKGVSTFSFDQVGKLLDEEMIKSGSGEWVARPDDELLTEEALRIISEAIDQLPDDFKTVLILRDVEGLSTDEVAEILGLTPAAVKSRLHRARLFLRDKLEDFYKQLFEGG